MNLSKSFILFIFIILLTKNSFALVGEENKTKVQENNLEFYLPFEDSFSDVKSNAGPTNIGGKFVEGKIGKAVQLNGLGEYIVLQRKFFDQHKDFSVSMWIMPSKSDEEQILLWQGESKEDLSIKSGARMSVSSNGTEITFKMESIVRDLSVKGRIEKDVWSHITLVLRGADSRSPSANLYIDGNLSSSTALNSTLNRNLNSSVIIGAPRLKKFYFKGKIDELHFYSSALSESQAKELFDEGVDCYKNIQCGEDILNEFCFLNLLCKNSTTYICGNPGKNSQCQIFTQNNCAVCELGCENGKCVEKNLPAEIPENDSIEFQRPEIKISIFRKIKCRIFHPFTKGNYLICLNNNKQNS